MGDNPIENLLGLLYDTNSKDENEKKANIKKCSVGENCLLVPMFNSSIGNIVPCLVGWSPQSCDVFITKAFHQKKELTFVNLSYESVFCNRNTVGKILM